MGRAHPNSQCLRPTQAGVADNVGGQDPRQFALLTGHGDFPRSLQRIVGARKAETIKSRGLGAPL